ncbi:hypothetical protein ACIQU5_32770 [Streptomyces sp. NPDC090306]|uniref:hypothetical protein n=1 Tax=Streptomyces sp. NPDC090306 TaxID=3365961 RepID=UPI00380E12D9
MGASVVLGIVAGSVLTLLRDRSWGSELLYRCLCFSLSFLVVRPVTQFARRRAEQRDAQHMRDIERARHGRHETRAGQQPSP